MTQEMSLDLAIEILEITDIGKINIDNLSNIVRKAKKRWHPDKVASLKDDTISRKYNDNFKLIDSAAKEVDDFLNGKVGDEGTDRSESSEEPVDVIRRNASEMQENISSVWSVVKERRFKFSDEEVLLSDGFSLKDVIESDFEESIAEHSIISFFYGGFFLSILAVILIAINPLLGFVGSMILFSHIASCFLGMMPLSRFWLPEQIENIMLKFINFGLIFYKAVFHQLSGKKISIWAWFALKAPEFLASLVRWLIIFPLYEAAKAFAGDKVVGIVKQNIKCYAGAPEWYVEELISKIPNDMSDDELFDLSYLNTELRNVI